MKQQWPFFLIFIFLLSPWAVGAGKEPLQWGINPQEGRIEFLAIGQPGLLTIEGRGGSPTGKIFLSPTGASGSLTLDLSTLDSGIAMRDQHLKEKYLEIHKGEGGYRQAELTLTQFKLPEGESFTKEGVPFEGRLKLHGVERPIKGEARLIRMGTMLKAQTELNLKLSDFQVSIPNYAGITVGEEVKVTVHLVGTLTNP